MRIDADWVAAGDGVSGGQALREVEKVKKRCDIQFVPGSAAGLHMLVELLRGAVFARPAPHFSL
jgi:hypothetical protein